FLKLAGRRCVVVGAGPVAEEKIEGLLRAGAGVRVVAPEATRRIRELARKKKLRWDKRGFRASDLSGAFLIVAATSSPSLHAQIYRQARRRGVLCNVADDPDHCDFYYGSVVRRGELQIAISTGGHSPALAQRLRKQMEKEFGAEYEEWLKELGKIRKRLFAKKITAERRRALLHELASAVSFEKFLGRKKQKSHV
ncbi:MAG: bifunctional precorrin-2 dehydrogenase/sirohydrochlorin ferrochelatase, partial [Gallionella sp.]